MHQHREQPGPSVPPEHRIAAEHVRAHLVYLRGGAPFLSPADALCLVRMLDEDVPVPAILAALDRCAESRRRNNARQRFSLAAAKRHLFKPPLTRVDPPSERAHPLEPLAAELGGHGLDLLAIDPSSTGVEQVVALCRDHVQRAWEDLGQGEQEARVQAAIEDLGDVANLVDRATLHSLAEEVAREAFRRQFPRMDTARIEGLLA